MSKDAGAAEASTAKPTLTAGGDAQDALAAELDGLLKARSGREDEGEQEAKTETEGDAKPEDEEKAEGEPEAEAQSEEDEEAAKAAEEEKAAAEKKVDPKAARGLEAVARAEKKFQQDKAKAVAQLNKIADDLATQKKEIEASAKAVQTFKSRAKSDPVGALLDALGEDVAPDVLGYVAQQFYARFKGLTDPKTGPELRAQAERDRAAREAQNRSQSAVDEIARMREELAAERAQIQQQRQIEEYMGTVVEAVSDETPLLAKAIKKNPKATKAELLDVAKTLAQETGDTPEPGEVVKSWEKWRRDQLRDRLDIDVDAVLKPPSSTPKKPNPVADEKKRPTPISSDLGTQVRPRSAPSLEELDADIERELRGQMRASGD